MRRFELGLAAATFVLVASAHAERAFVTSNSIKVVDDRLGQVIGAIDLGKSFVRDIVVTTDGRTAYFAHTRGVAVVDVGTSQVRASWGDRTVSDLALDEAGGLLYTLQHKAGEPYQVVAYTITSGAESRRFPVDAKTSEIAVVGSGRLFASNVAQGSVTSYDRASGEARQRVPVVTAKTSADGETYLSCMQPSADGRFVYVLLNGEHAGVLVLDALSAETVRDIRLGHPAYVRAAVASADGQRLYLSALDHLAVVDLAAGKELAWINLGASHQGMALSHDGSFVYLVNPVLETSGSLAIVDARTFELTKRIDIPDMSPFRVAVVP